MLKLAYIILFAALIAPIFDISNEYVYLLCLLTVVPIGVIGCVFRKKGAVLKFGAPLSYIPLLLLLMWFYGVLRGYMLGNNTEYIIRNFSGLVMYSVFYFFIFVDISYKSLFRLMAASAAVGLVGAIIGTDYGRLMSMSEYDAIGASKSYRSLTLLYLLPFLAVWLIVPLNRHSVKNVAIYKVFLPAILIFYLTIPTISKGNILIVAIVCAIALMRSSGQRNRVVGGALLVLPLVVYMLMKLFDMDIGSVLELYSSDNVSNRVRSNQLVEILDDISFFGNGLGAVLRGGYVRDVELPYGLELTYLSLIHKMGVFSILFFLALYWTGVGIYKIKDLALKSFLFGSMLYLIPAAANPILFSPQVVIIHSAVLAILVRLKFGIYLQSSYRSR